MASPLAQGLFHKTIAQSGYDAMLRPLRRESSSEPLSLEEAGEKVVHALGCDQTSDTLHCLRSMPPQTILTKIYASGANTPRLTLVKDGYILPESPRLVFKKGTQSKVPTIIGVMKNEQIADPSLKKLTTVEAYKCFLSACFPKNAEEVFKEFPAQQPNEIFAQAERLMTHFYATGPARRMATAMNQIDAPTFWFRFVRIPPFAREQNLGSFHSLDVSYVFQSDMIKPYFEDLDFTISLQVQKMWASFARHGIPTPDKSWPHFDSNHQRYLEMGDEFVARDSLERSALDLLDRVERGNCVIE